MHDSGLDRPTTFGSRLLALAPWLLLLVLGYALHRTHGHYGFREIALTAVIACPAAIAMFRPPSDRISERASWIVAGAVLVAFMGLLATSSRLLYARPGDALYVLHGSILLGLLASVAIVAGAVLGYARASVRARIVELGAFVSLCLLLGQVMTIRASPSPFIDVWTITTSAADHLLGGRNPYAQSYEDIYRGAYDYQPGMSYLPLLLYWVTPFRALFGDIRYAFFAADLLTAAALYWLSRQRGLPRATSGAFPLLWLAFPVVFFVLEQSWIDTLLVSFVVLTAIALQGRRWVLVGLCVGCAMAVKHYALLIAPVTGLVVLRQDGARALWRFGAVAFGTFAATVIPFLLLDEKSFYAGTVTRVLGFGFRRDSFSLTALLANESGWLLPPSASFVATAGALVAVCRWLNRRREPSLRDWSAALCVVYFAFFATAQQSFCNYYRLVAGFLVVYLLCDASERSSGGSTADAAMPPERSLRPPSGEPPAHAQQTATLRGPR